MRDPLLELRDVSIEYPARRWRARGNRAVDGVSLAVGDGESVGLVGESGSGKTSIGAAIVGLAPIVAGSVHFDGADITHATPPERRRLSREIQVIFQDPYSSLNPARSVGQTLAEPLLVHSRAGKSEIRSSVAAALERVGLEADASRRYPAQFSGGQRQRIAIARALMLSPRLVICDEAVSALDLSVQAQILNLLLELQRALALSYVFISHDMDVVRHMSDRIVVLYRGSVVEAGEARAVHDAPSHPYTQALLAAAPVPDPRRQVALRAARSQLATTTPVRSPGTGCPFVARCPIAIARCETEVPTLERAPGGTMTACHRSHELALDTGRDPVGACISQAEPASRPDRP